MVFEQALPPGVEFHGTAIQFFDFYCRQQLTKEIHTSCISKIRIANKESKIETNI